jgi:cyclohexanone monooxygenase
MESVKTAATQIDVVVVGAGFAGLRALHTLRSQGLSVVVIEAGTGVGGVWNWNRYPGARCDVESYDYSYSFSEELQQEWRWSERYAQQPEILSYLNHVADRFDLRRDIHLNTRMERAHWQQDDARWDISTDTGEHWSARYLVMATGQLSTTKAPNFPGAQTFTGEIYHTGKWPHEPVDLSGKRVGIIGTGSSGMQMTPVVAQVVDHLTVFQRTANYSVPASNAPLTDEHDAAVKATYRERREAARNSPSGLSHPLIRLSALEVTDEEREAHFEKSWTHLGFGFALCYRDLLLDIKANDYASDFVRRKIAEQVTDPVVRDRLTPKNFPFGTKRPSVDSSYFPTFNRPNVTLADVREDPIVEITPTGIRTESTHYDLDVIVYATGFDVFTGSLLAIDIQGRDAITLRDKWSEGPRTYLGLMTSDFPNLFMVAGPGSPSLLSNVIVSTEAHVDLIAELIAHADAAGVTEIEPTDEAVTDWVKHVNEKAQETLYPLAKSYYNGDEIEGKPRVFMPYSGGVRGYRRILSKVVENGYEGFSLRSERPVEVAST